MTILMVVCLIAVAVGCSGGETGESQAQVESRGAPASTSVPSVRAQVTEPSPTVPLPTATAPPTSAPATPALSSGERGNMGDSASLSPSPQPSPSRERGTTASPLPSNESGNTSDESAPATVSDEERDLKIVTLLPFDAIPAILEPEFVSAEEADAELDPQSLVMGLSIDGDHRAYSIPTLSSHEIVNDTVGGKPVAVTW